MHSSIQQAHQCCLVLYRRSELQSGNAIIQMTLHLGMTVGPVLAAIIIAGEISSVTQQDNVSQGFLVTLMPINKDYHVRFMLML